MKVKGEGGREGERRAAAVRARRRRRRSWWWWFLPCCHHPVSSEQWAAQPRRTGERATYLPVQVSRRAVALFSPLYCHSPSPPSRSPPSLRGCAGRQDKRTRELVGCSLLILLPSVRRCYRSDRFESRNTFFGQQQQLILSLVLSWPSPGYLKCYRILEMS